MGKNHSEQTYPSDLVTRCLNLQRQLRDHVLATIRQSSLEELSGVASETEGDTIFRLDRLSEPLLISLLKEHFGGKYSFVLICEGLTDKAERVFPETQNPTAAQLRIIIDPIDGTRGLMYDKRSAWILMGVAPNLGEHTTLQDVEIAVQTEIPTSKGLYSDSLWAIKGQSTMGERQNLLTGECHQLCPRPSKATSLRYGFATIAKFFPGGTDLLARISEELVAELLGPLEQHKAHVFEDQYISTGGQFYELIMGHDRLIADLRSCLDSWLIAHGRPLPLCCHPYDLCTMLIAKQAGVIVTDATGNPLNAPLNTTENLSWIAYANDKLREVVEPVLLRLLRKHKLI
ncbi:inositol monophosphatase [candidate division KSB1 bacterium]|nr:MAG: inositol monophosphatase [candidate division KSB1 bacterium]